MALGEYQAAIRDIERARNHGYPKPKKLMERKDRCVGLSDKERHRKEYCNILPEIDFGPANNFPCASSSISLQFNNDKGRHFVAIQDIAVGSVIMVEAPYAAVLDTSCWNSHCYHCLSRLPSDCVPCRGCTEVLFCDELCSKAAQSYHVYECSKIFTLKKLQNWLFDYRVITVTGFSRISDIVAHSTNKCPEVYEALDYFNIYNLVGHDSPDCLEKAIMAVHLIKILKSCRFFPSVQYCGLHKIEVMDVCQECQIMVGGVLLRHMKNLQCNGYDVYERLDSGQTLNDSSYNKIGSAVHATLSLINHSCQPNVMRLSYKNTGVIRAIRNIKKGEDIVGCYGGDFTKQSKKERQDYLLKNYFFQCKCVPCTLNWPTYKELCQAFMNDPEQVWLCCKCKKSFIVDAEDETYSCSCGHITNVQAITVSMQKSFQKYTEAVHQVENRVIKGVLQPMFHYLTAMEKLEPKPSIECIGIEQNIKLCFTLEGNYCRE